MAALVRNDLAWERAQAELMTFTLSLDTKRQLYLQTAAQELRRLRVDFKVLALPMVPLFISFAKDLLVNMSRSGV